MLTFSSSSLWTCLSITMCTRSEGEMGWLLFIQVPSTFS